MTYSEKYFKKIYNRKDELYPSWDYNQIKRYGEYCRLEEGLSWANATGAVIAQDENKSQLNQMAAEDGLI